MSRIVFPPDYGPTVPSAGDMTPFQTVGGALVVDPGVPLTSWDDPSALTVQSMFRRHPSVRKVTTFIASNIASIPLHVYRMAGETSRERVREGNLAGIVSWPTRTPGVTPLRFWESVLLDGLIFDRVCVQISVADDGTPELVRIPPGRWRVTRDGIARVAKLQLATGDGGEWATVDPSTFLLDTGYTTGAVSVSPLESLRIPVEDYLAEATYRRDLWEKGPRFSGIVERDTKWPSMEARTRFLGGLGQFNRAGARTGTTMLLDDGMHWKDVQGVNPKDVASVEARQQSDVEVASAFHIAPELVGARQGTFANLEAFRQSLWSVALGPYISQWEQFVRPLVAMFGVGDEYVEANVQAKLRGSFEEQAQQLQTSVGAPWMTRNEARSRVNMPAVDGGDALITPLNVIEGGQASPTDAAPPKGRAVDVKVRDSVEVKEPGDVDPSDRDDVEGVLRRFWDRQSRSVVPAIHSGHSDWWDKARWDKELADDLLDVALSVSATVGRETAKLLGDDPSSYSVARTVAYLAKVTAARAEWINDATYQGLTEAIASDDEARTPERVFDVAKSDRAIAAAGALTAALGSFSKTEAAKQGGHNGATKTWRTHSKHPRAAHAAMNGVTVPLHDTFPNGMKWPGDPAGGVDEVAGCMCGVEMEIP